MVDAARAIRTIGRGASWLLLAVVLLTFAIVVLRYGFNLGWIWLQESVTWLHAAVFCLAAAWTLQDDGHVRVDVFYRGAGPRRQALVNGLGALFLLLPMCAWLAWSAWPYVVQSWTLLEGSREAGGLPGVFLLKSLLLVLPLLLGIQGLLLAGASLRRWRRASA